MGEEPTTPGRGGAPSIDLSPEQFRRLGYRAVDLVAEHLATVRDRPVRVPVPADVRERLMTAPGAETLSEEEILDIVRDDVLAYPMGNASPRFFGWVNSPPAPLGILGDLLASGSGPSVAGGDHAATYVEHGVLEWLRTVVGYPSDARGVLTSGGSAANLIGLAAMRHVMTGGSARREGLAAVSDPMTVYTSTEGHSSIQKAVELLGFGSDHLRQVPVDRDLRMDVGELRRMIAVDREAGARPVAVAATAGTVNSGAIDPLDQIADLCSDQGLWMHVDGAYGGVGVLDPGIAPMYRGLERADSVAIDPHKWLSAPVECGCAMVRDGEAMRTAFSLVPAYLRDDTEMPWFSEFGIQQTRGFRALKLWMVLNQIGEVGYRRLIRRDIDLAATLAAKLESLPDFEVLAHGPLSIVCFRHLPETTDDLDAHNAAVARWLQRDGEAFLTSTTIRGDLALRACIVNFRTTEEDLDRLIGAIRRAAAAVRGGPDA